MRKRTGHFEWKGQVETLEDRRVMSADPFLGGGIVHHGAFDEEAPQIEHQLVSEPDFWLDPNDLISIDDQLDRIEQTLYSAHNTTGLNSVVSNYGFTGVGQTVAVIDSGIAYDHFALGGGFGSNYKVVGGWDFTGENDGNPYDDGPSGSHGTHVAGIVGGTSGNDKGVAPGVDLVALRVFDDVGNGYFSWVENALKWVIQNRTAFENPITAINLSLGVSSWNSNTIPGWSTLEDEFATLKAAGVFIAVSAGNSFGTFNEPGLSYPAASPNVVPVMSVTDSGALASYSQRDTRAIAAPGSAIRSTVPDYKGNNNGVADDYAIFSGTSMAAPYIAGASVLIRQAMEFAGYTNITQDTIYDHMMSTATSFVDSVTGITFKRLNLQAAIDVLIPQDPYGSTVQTAYAIGTVGDLASLDGVISTVDDVDYFTFTAGQSGKATLKASNMTHGMTASWSTPGIAGSVGGTNGETFTFDVVAGQTYTVGIASGSGIGHYDLDMSIQSSLPSVPLMTIKSFTHSNGAVYSLDSDGWISINNNRVWENTRDFALRADGSVIWLSCTGVLAQRMPNGTWKTLDRDALKFDLDSAGNVYSLGADAWVNVNGVQIWENSAAFDVAPNQSLVWHSINGNLYRRATGGPWTLIDKNVAEIAVANNSAIYALRNTHWVSYNGSATWENSFDFICTPDNTVYWHSTNGSLSMKPNGGAWQQQSTNVSQFALRQDGVLYVLKNDGRLQLDGTTLCSGVRELKIDNFGQMVIHFNNGAKHALAGRYAVSTNMTLGTTVAGVPSGVGGLTAETDHDIAFEAIGRATFDVLTGRSISFQVENDTLALTKSIGNEVSFDDFDSVAFDLASAVQALQENITNEPTRMSCTPAREREEAYGPICDEVVSLMDSGLGGAREALTG